MTDDEFIQIPDEHPLRYMYYRIDLGEGDCFAHPVLISPDGKYVVLRHTARIEPPLLEWAMDKRSVVDVDYLQTNYLWREKLEAPVNKLAIPGFGWSDGMGKQPNPLR